MKPKLKAPGTKRLTLKCDEPLSSFAFKYNLRRYTTDDAALKPRARALEVLGMLVSARAGPATNCSKYPSNTFADPRLLNDLASYDVVSNVCQANAFEPLFM
jgi:hypothetical protein